MVKHLLATACAALLSLPLLSARAAPPVRTMYVEAMAREQAVRTALADESAPDSVLKTVRAVVASYESIVRHYPTSSYCDNALWQAGRLALDAFERFGEPLDQATGTRLLRFLASEYPSSKLARQVPQILAPSAGSASSRDVRATTLAPVVPGRAARLVIIKAIHRTVLPDAVRVTIELDAEVPSFHEERISGPARIFVDFPSSRAASGLVDQTLRFDSDADIVRQVRIGRHPNATTRIVLDAAGVSSYSVYPLYNPYRLVIDCQRPVAASGGTEAPWVTPAWPRVAASVEISTPHLPAGEVARPVLVGRRLRSEWGRGLPSGSPAGSASIEAASVRILVSRSLVTSWRSRLPSASPWDAAAIADALAPAAADRLAVVTVTPPLGTPPLGTTPLVTPPSAASPPAPVSTPNLGAGPSMARQLGLGVSRIVIDPGHGGHDPGAQGKGVTEAELVLDVSLRLQKLLEKVRGVEVILTRQTDDFVPLQERTAIANREGADLFLSIHANASANNQARGIETYFLNFANNLSAAAVAARENAASGQAMGALPDFVKAIALNNKLDESRDFATRVQHEMVDRLRATNKTVKNLGVKQAPFVVLIGASMPSVLAEISFLTNAQEAKLLKGGAYRQRIAEALFTAIRTYQTSLTKGQTVAER
jgi:N-acetylmuramoyl-L-alanine amidase